VNLIVGYVTERGYAYCVDHNPDATAEPTDLGNSANLDMRCEACGVKIPYRRDWYAFMPRATEATSGISLATRLLFGEEPA
jgi:hypothetical protein